MPYTLHVDVEDRRVVFRASGTYSNDEAFGSIQDMIGHPDFQAGFDVLVDMTAVEDVPLWGDDIREKVSFDQGLLPKLGQARWAFVVPNDAVYGLARMYQTLMADTAIQVEAFRDLRMAEDWLDAP